MSIEAIFGTRLNAAVGTRGPLCVGIDPHPGLLVDWGLTVDPAGLERFALTVVEALADRVAVLKPQSAFFERFGSAGIAVLERVVAEARSAGALVLLDVKRGDIGSTAEAYAAAYLDQSSPMAVDAVTVSPYLGFGSVRPFVDAALEHGGGVFVLALTSNPEGHHVQHARAYDGRTVAQTIIDEVSVLNAVADPLGSIGVVVGLTTGSNGHDLSRLNGPILGPGLGAQGGQPENLQEVFGNALPWVLPSTSREVLRHGPDISGLRRSVETTQAALGTVLAPG